MLYVLNAGGSGYIAGFRVDNRGMLSPLAGSTRPLSNMGVGAAPAVAQVQFDETGRFLVVTEKSTSRIDVYTVGANGLASGPATYASHGSTPFGFAFDKRNHLIVSEAAANALSSYDLSSSGALSVISASVNSNGAAPCWVVVTKNGRYAFTTNAHSNTIAGFMGAQNGGLTLLHGLTSAGAAPTDVALSVSNHFLYALESGSHAVGAFAVQEDGSLVTMSAASGLPASAVGIAAR